VKNKLHPYFYFHVSYYYTDFISERGLRGNCRTRYHQVGLIHNQKFRLAAALAVETENECKTIQKYTPANKILSSQLGPCHSLVG
jgi:hypothetical protein